MFRIVSRALKNLLEEVRVTPLGDGRYRAELSEAWSFFTPGGGVLLAIAVNAMRTELGDLAPLSVTTVFCSPVPAGVLTIEVRVLRRGSVFSQVQASLRNGQERGLEVIATFGRRREGYPDETESAMPAVPHYSELPPAPANPRMHMRFFDNFEHRIALGHLSWEKDWEPGPARYARWIRYRETPRASDGAIDPVAYAVIVDLMPPSLVNRLGPSSGRTGFYFPSLDLTMHFFERTEAEWFLLSCSCRRAIGGVASAQVELFDESGKLLCYATQVMMMKRWPRS